MSQGYACKDRTHRAGGHWVVWQRESNHSAFSGYRYTPSSYSCVKCMECGAVWRTKAGYVRLLRDATTEETRMHTHADR